MSKELLYLMLVDCITVIRDEKRHMETRMFAQIMARNIASYDPSMVTDKDYSTVFSPMRVSGSGTGSGK